MCVEQADVFLQEMPANDVGLGGVTVSSASLRSLKQRGPTAHTPFSFSKFGWWKPSMLNRSFGIGDQALRPSASSFHSFSGLSTSPANRQLMPITAIGEFDAILSGCVVALGPETQLPSVVEKLERPEYYNVLTMRRMARRGKQD